LTFVGNPWHWNLATLVNCADSIKESVGSNVGIARTRNIWPH